MKKITQEKDPRKRKCLRCGKIIPKKFFYLAVTEFDVITFNAEATIHSRLCTDLCKTCYEKLKKFLRNYRDN